MPYPSNPKLGQDLQRLKAVSVDMGKDPALVQASGGNTSLKEQGVLWIKASGKSLALSDQDDTFIPLALDRVLEEAASPDEFSLGLQSLSKNDLRPSIETTMHALIPHAVVLHSHAIDIIAISLLPEAQTRIRDALNGINWHWIPYQRPGKPLTQEIINALDRQPADVFILANHGLVVGASNPDEAAALQAEVTQRLRQTAREYMDVNISEISKVLASLDGAYLPESSVIHSLAIDPWSLELAQRNPAYPDHVVFCGVRPWVKGFAEIPRSIETKYGLIPGVGVFLLPAANAATQAMLQAQAEILLRIPPGEEINLLTDHQCDELLNWEAEKYRQDLVKSV